jgi:hypothetical protein
MCNNTKECKQCGLEKSFDDYNKDKLVKDGHSIRCKECRSKNRKKDPNIIIEKHFENLKQTSIKLYGDNYDFSDAVYVDLKNTKMKIKCKKHNCVIYENEGGIEPHRFIRNNMYCEKCKDYDNYVKKQKHNIEKTKEIIVEVEKRFPKLYDLSNFEYIGYDEEYDIRCNKHNENMIMTVSGMYKGYSCDICTKEKLKNSLETLYRKTFYELVEKNQKDTNYDYSKCDPKYAKSIVTIGCPEKDHGYFEQVAYYHTGGSECQKCAMNKRIDGLSRTKSSYGYNELNYFIPYVKNILPTYDIIEQYPVNDEKGVIKYYIDLYVPELDVAIEYDEERHFTPKHMILDDIRQSYIEETIGCEFIRIRDTEFMKDEMYVNKKFAPIFGYHLLTESIEELFE